MPFSLPDLPYAHDALAPHMSRETLEYHHDKHHLAYVNNGNNLLKGTEWENKSLEDVVKGSFGKNAGLFNNAGQHYNHMHFWKWMKPNGGGDKIPGELQKKIDADLGGTAKMKEDFIQARTEGLDSLRPLLQGFSPEHVSSRTGVAAASLREAARVFAGAKRAVILISTGQASDHKDAALAAAASNLALLTGHLGQEGSGVFLLGEKNNSQGALDMGGVPGLLPRRRSRSRCPAPSGPG